MTEHLKKATCDRVEWPAALCVGSAFTQCHSTMALSLFPFLFACCFVFFIYFVSDTFLGGRALGIKLYKNWDSHVSRVRFTKSECHPIYPEVQSGFDLGWDLEHLRG